MAPPTSRQELIDYCLRELGHPVIEINLDPDQIEDRVDWALQKFRNFHFDGTERMFVKHEVTQTDIDNEWIPMDEKIIAVVRVFPHHTSQVTNNIFNIRYQISLNDFYDISSIDLSYYDSSKRHINLLDELLVGEQSIRFNRHTDRIYIDADWEERFAVGDILLFEVHMIVDPEEYNDVYNDEFLKKYLTALLKKQWGNNLKKFSGVQLPGGVELNGSEIYNEAVEEIKELEEELDMKYSVPPIFFLR